MPRKPQVRYFASRGAYYCQLNGRQHKLAVGPDDGPSGPTFAEATRRYAELIGLTGAPTAQGTNTVRVVCEYYLRAVADSPRSAGTLRIRQDHLRQFCDGGYGERPVSGLTLLDLQAYIAGKRARKGKGSEKRARAWTSGTVRICIASIRAALRWAVRAKLIAGNPLEGVESPPGRSRGREAVLDPAQHAHVLRVVSRAMRPVVVVLEATGCRPGEIAAATAADFDAQVGAIVYHAAGVEAKKDFQHKTAGAGKVRCIMLTGEALELVRAAVQAHPTGPLFRTSQGRPWTNRGIAKRFEAMRGRTGIPALTAYSYRHTFATRWLQQGGSIDLLAELLGNSPAVIRRHYSHLCADRDALRARLEAFRAGEGTQTPTPRLRVVGE